MFERYVNFEFYKTLENSVTPAGMFERYVNFEFYKTYIMALSRDSGLRDM